MVAKQRNGGAIRVHNVQGIETYAVAIVVLVHTLGLNDNAGGPVRSRRTRALVHEENVVLRVFAVPFLQLFHQGDAPVGPSVIRIIRKGLILGRIASVVERLCGDECVGRIVGIQRVTLVVHQEILEEQLRIQVFVGHQDGRTLDIRGIRVLQDGRNNAFGRCVGQAVFANVHQLVGIVLLLHTHNGREVTKVHAGKVADQHNGSGELGQGGRRGNIGIVISQYGSHAAGKDYFLPITVIIGVRELGADAGKHVLFRVLAAGDGRAAAKVFRAVGNEMEAQAAVAYRQVGRKGINRGRCAVVVRGGRLHRCLHPLVKKAAAAKDGNVEAVRVYAGRHAYGLGVGAFAGNRHLEGNLHAGSFRRHFLVQLGLLQAVTGRQECYKEYIVYLSHHCAMVTSSRFWSPQVKVPLLARMP